VGPLPRRSAWGPEAGTPGVFVVSLTGSLLTSPGCEALVLVGLRFYGRRNPPEGAVP